MSEITEEIRYVMLFYYRKGKNAAEAYRKIFEVYGKNVVSERTTREWFADSVPEIRMSKMHLVLVDQSLKKSVKFCNWWSRTGTQAVKKYQRH